MKKDQSLKIQFHWTTKLSEQKKQDWNDKLFELSKENLSVITKEYLRKRIDRYEGMITAHSKGKLVGYMFTHIYEAQFPIVKMPTVHIGLTVVDRKFRGQNMAGKFAYQVYLATKEKLGGSFFFSGVLLTSKCSSPISFLRMQKASLNFGLPRIKNEEELDLISNSAISKYISKIITKTISNSENPSFLLKDVNDDSGFKLESENYQPRNPFEAKTIKYFERHVMPKNELLYVSWVHPTFLLWW